MSASVKGRLMWLLELELEEEEELLDPLAIGLWCLELELEEELLDPRTVGSSVSVWSSSSSVKRTKIVRADGFQLGHGFADRSSRDLHDVWHTSLCLALLLLEEEEEEGEQQSVNEQVHC